MSSHKRQTLAVLAILALAALALSGCIEIRVVDRLPPIPEPTSDVKKLPVEEHDLAVLAVDFDPPLEYDKIMDRRKRGEGITLLVAIENTGANTERNVTVQVTLYKGKDDQVLLERTGTIDSIVPGEIKIIHFKDTDIPLSYEYHLSVRVLPVVGEDQLLNNHKEYDLLITQPE